MSKRLLIVGAGGHGRSVAEAVLSSDQYQLVGFVDDVKTPAAEIWGRRVLGPTTSFAEYHGRADAVIVAIGNNQLREELHVRLMNSEFEFATVIHPQSIVSSTALVGPGCAVMAGAIIGVEATLGEGVIVNCGAVVDHHCTIEDFGHLGTNACMAGGAVLGRGAWMQAGSAVGYGVHVKPGEVLTPGQAKATK